MLYYFCCNFTIKISINVKLIQREKKTTLFHLSQIIGATDVSGAPRGCNSDLAWATCARSDVHLIYTWNTYGNPKWSKTHASGRTEPDVDATEEYKSRNRSARARSSGSRFRKARLKIGTRAHVLASHTKEEEDTRGIRSGKKNSEAGTIMRENGERCVKFRPLSNGNAPLVTFPLFNFSSERR